MLKKIKEQRAAKEADCSSTLTHFGVQSIVAAMQPVFPKVIPYKETDTTNQDQGTDGMN